MNPLVPSLPHSRVSSRDPSLETKWLPHFSAVRPPRLSLLFFFFLFYPVFSAHLVTLSPCHPSLGLQANSIAAPLLARFSWRFSFLFFAWPRQWESLLTLAARHKRFDPFPQSPRPLSLYCNVPPSVFPPQRPSHLRIFFFSVWLVGEFFGTISSQRRSTTPPFFLA